MREITLEELLEAGCHFGHQITRHNPKSRDFVFEARDNIHIIDLAKTKEGLEQAMTFVKNLAAKNGTMIVVGPKRQARGIVAEEVKRAQDAGVDGLFAVTNRWIGGTLTNFSEVSKNYKRLKDFTARLQNDEEKARFTKKEVGQWEKSRVKLESFYGGLANAQGTPDALFIIDTHLEALAVREARAMHVKTVGIVDTNADPFVIDYPIPANDDAVGSIKLIVSAIIDAWIEGAESRRKGETSSPASEADRRGTNEHDKEEVQKTEAKTEKKKKEKKEKTTVKKAKKPTKKKDAETSSA